MYAWEELVSELFCFAWNAVPHMMINILKSIAFKKAHFRHGRHKEYQQQTSLVFIGVQIVYERQLAGFTCGTWPAQLLFRWMKVQKLL